MSTSTPADPTVTATPVTLRTVPSADLDRAGRLELRGVLDAAFDEHGFTDEHWGHALGGVHVLARRDGALVGHAAVVGRQLIAGGRTLRTGYVEAVAVAPGAHRQGIAGVIMVEVERLIRGGSELGALAASEAGAGLYRSRGWLQWQGPLCALTPDGRIEGDASRVFVLPTPATPPLDPGGQLTCDWRSGSLW